MCQTVITTMKNYGLILADNGSNWYFQGTADTRWTDTDVDQLKQIPASAFQAVDESSLMVNANSGQAAQPVSPAPPTTVVRPAPRPLASPLRRRGRDTSDVTHQTVAPATAHGTRCPTATREAGGAAPSGGPLAMSEVRATVAGMGSVPSRGSPSPSAAWRSSPGDRLL